jgi:hypothetical protein
VINARSRIAGASGTDTTCESSGYGDLMASELTVRVPQDLAWDLVDEGFRQVEQLRGSDWLSQGVTVAVTVVGATADLTTLILAKDSIARFVRRVTTWALGESGGADLNRLRVRFDVTRPGSTRSQRHFEAELTTSDPISDTEMSRIISFIAAAFDDSSD